MMKPLDTNLKIGDDHCTILGDECSDISQKEQLVVCLCYVCKENRP